MAGRSVRRSRAQKRTVIFVAIVTLIFAAFISVKIIQTWQETEKLKENRAALESSLSIEEARAELLRERDEKGLSLEEIIELARERYGLVFPNEILFEPEE